MAAVSVKRSIGEIKQNELDCRDTAPLTKFRILPGRVQSSRLFTSFVEDLNLGLPRTNPASGQGRT